VSTNQIKLPDIAPDKQNSVGGPSVSHGIAVTSDQKMAVVQAKRLCGVLSPRSPRLFPEKAAAFADMFADITLETKFE
jgi:hypothetical protein